ncbi:metallophosphoesterase family protein [Thermosipho affectus]|nr:metallophosphoesterase [Thermosipho affectus]
MLKKMVFLFIFVPMFLFSNVFYYLYEENDMCKLCDGEFFPNTTNLVAVYGDSRFGNKVHIKIVELISSYNPTVVVHLGDMVNRGDRKEEWNTFFKITKNLRKNSYFQLVKGNHENPDVYYKKYFGLYNYYADFKKYRLIFLDPYTKGYLEFLENYGNERSIVFLHYPIYTVGPHWKDRLDLSKLDKIVADKGIKIVISGHEHNYQHFYVNNTHYIITGGAGASLYGKVIDNEYLVSFYKEYHFVLLELNDDLNIKVIDLNNKILEEFNVEF